MFFDVMEVFNRNIGRKLTIMDIVFEIRTNPEIRKGKEGIPVNEIGVYRQVHKFFMKGRIKRELQPDGRTYVYFANAPLRDKYF